MITRTLTIPMLAAAALLALAGCSGAPDAPETSSPEAVASSDLAGTSWSGEAERVAQLAFTLNEDGTVDFSSFDGESFDSPTDVWSVDGETFSLTISQLQDQEGNVTDITYTGPASTGTMELTGSDTAGTGGYPLTITEG